MPRKKKKFEIIVPVEARGWQAYEVAAKDADEALEMWKQGKTGECVQEELEVQKTGEPEIKEIKE